MTEGKFISRRTHSRCASARATVDVRRPLKDGLIPGPRRRAVADGRMDAQREWACADACPSVQPPRRDGRMDAQRE